MKRKLILYSGGQTGADQGSLQAAKAAGIQTGGFAARRWLTETGPAPWLASFGLVEMDGGYAERTHANVALLNGFLGVHGSCLWFGKDDTPGAKCTLGACRRRGIDVQQLQLP